MCARGKYSNSEQMTAVIYARLSFGKQRREVSLQKQLSCCWDFCNEKRLTVRYVFIEQCPDGDYSLEPDFAKIVQRTRSEGSEPIVFYEFDKVTLLKTSRNRLRIGNPQYRIHRVRREGGGRNNENKA